MYIPLEFLNSILFYFSRPLWIPASLLNGLPWLNKVTYLLDLSGAVSGLNDVNKYFSVFCNKLNKLLNKHAPFKPIKKRKKTRLLKPWVTKGIRKSIKIKNDLFLCSGDTAAYKLYRSLDAHAN